MKRVGVVIPVYNTEKFLCQCIDSVIGQSYPEICIALVNDGSTDKSADICSEYAKKYSNIKVIHQHNQGKLSARYNGALSLNCDYLTFVDSDDWISPISYENFSDMMDNEVDVISWQIIRYFTVDRQTTSMHNFPVGLYNYERYRKEIYPYMIWNFENNTYGVDSSLCNKLIKKDLVLNSLLAAQRLHVSYGDDIAVIYPLLKKIKSIYLSSDALYYHRQRDSKEYAPYLLERCFYKNLFLLYEYLYEVFRNEKKLLKQLDMFYAYSTSLHLAENKCYLNRKEQYIFPFNINSRVKSTVFQTVQLSVAYPKKGKASILSMR